MEIYGSIDMERSGERIKNVKEWCNRKLAALLLRYIPREGESEKEKYRGILFC